MNKLSVAVIGAGNIAGGFDENKLDDDSGIYTHAGAYRTHGNFELETVFDYNLQRAAEFAQIWHVKQVAEQASDIYQTFHDVISVCSPDHAHYETLRQILQARCCRTIFVEKPLTSDLNQIGELIQLADQAGIQIVVNFQRKNELEHRNLRDVIANRPGHLLSVSGCYMKGLVHSGITIIDSLSHLCGLPDATLAYNKVFNQEVSGDSYEFVLFYPGFTAAIRTTDSENFRYNYHIFEMDFLFSDRRLTLVDISQGIREAPVTGYAYSGVKVMNDRAASVRDTRYKTSMVDAVTYVHDVTVGSTRHVLNRPENSYNNALIVNRIIESYDRGSVKLPFEAEKWKK